MINHSRKKQLGTTDTQYNIKLIIKLSQINDSKYHMP